MDDERQKRVINWVFIPFSGVRSRYRDPRYAIATY